MLIFLNEIITSKAIGNYKAQDGPPLLVYTGEVFERFDEKDRKMINIDKDLCMAYSLC